MHEFILFVNDLFEILYLPDALQYLGEFTVIDSTVVEIDSIDIDHSKVLESFGQSITMTNTKGVLF